LDDTDLRRFLIWSIESQHKTPSLTVIRCRFLSSYFFYSMSLFPHLRDVIRPGFLNVSCEKGNDDGAGTYDGYGQPDDISQWPTKAIRLPHGNQQVCNEGQAKEYY